MIFEVPGGGNWEEKSTKNRSKIEAKIECVPGSIFDGILVDFGSQVGVGNRPEIDSRRYENMQANKRAKQSVLEAS